jgi:hypothetical protein
MRLRVENYPGTAVERAMKVEEVVLVQICVGGAARPEEK